MMIQLRKPKACLEKYKNWVSVMKPREERVFSRSRWSTVAEAAEISKKKRNLGEKKALDLAIRK